MNGEHEFRLGVIERSIRDIDKRLSRVEKVLIALAVISASPKLGGPDPSKLVATLLNIV